MKRSTLNLLSVMFGMGSILCGIIQMKIQMNKDQPSGILVALAIAGIAVGLLSFWMMDDE